MSGKLHLVEIIGRVAALVLLTAGCRVAADLLPVPPPAGLETMTVPVQEQYGARRQAVDRLMAGPSAPAQLGAAFGELGMWYHAYGLSEGAGAAYRNARRLAPEDSRWSYYLGLLEVANGRPEPARDHFARVLEAGDNVVPSSVRLAELELAAGELAAAEARLETVLAADPRCVRAMVARAAVAEKRGHDEESVVWLRRALERQPTASRIRYALGLAYRRLGEVEQAEAFLAASDPERAELLLADPLYHRLRTLDIGTQGLLRRAREVASAGRDSAALELFRAAAAAEPESLKAHLGIARSLERLDRTEEAMAVYQAVLERFPDAAAAHQEIASIQLRRGRPEEAEENLRAALRSQPNYMPALLALASLATERGDLEGALEHLAIARGIRPGGSRICRLHAALLIRMGRLTEARDALEADLKTSPESRRLTLLLARLLATAREPVRDGAASLRLAAGAFRRRPGLDAAEVVALALAQNGRFEAASALQSHLVEAARSAGMEDFAVSMEARQAHFLGRRPERDPLPPEQSTSEVFVPPAAVERHIAAEVLN